MQEGVQLPGQTVTRLIDEDPITGGSLADALAQEVPGVTVEGLREMNANVIANIIAPEFQPSAMRALEDRMQGMLDNGATPQEIISAIGNEADYAKFNGEQLPMLRKVLDGLVPGANGHTPTRTSTVRYAGVTPEAMDAARARMSAAGTNPATRQRRMSASVLQRLEQSGGETIQTRIRQATGDDTWTVSSVLEPADMDNVVVTLQNASDEAATMRISVGGDAYYQQLDVLDFAGDEEVAAVLAGGIHQVAPSGLGYSNGLGDVLDASERSNSIDIMTGSIGRRADELLQTNSDLSMAEAVAQAIETSPQGGALTEAMEREGRIVQRFGNDASRMGSEALRSPAERVTTSATNIRNARYTQNLRVTTALAVDQAQNRIITVRNARGADGESLTTLADLAEGQAIVDEVVGVADLPADLRNTARDEVMNTVRGFEQSRNRRVINQATHRLAESPEGAAAYDRGAAIGPAEGRTALREHVEAGLTEQFGSVYESEAARGLAPTDLYVEVPDIVTFQAEDFATARVRRDQLGAISVAQGEEARGGLPRGAIVGEAGPLDEWRVPRPEDGSAPMVRENNYAAIALKLQRGEYERPAHAIREVAAENNTTGRRARRAIATVLMRMDNPGHYADFVNAGVEGHLRFGGLQGVERTRAEIRQLLNSGTRPEWMTAGDYERALVSGEMTGAFAPGAGGAIARSDDFVRLEEVLRLDRAASEHTVSPDANAFRADRAANPDTPHGLEMRSSPVLRDAVRNDALYRLRAGEANDLEDLFQILSADWDVPVDRQLRMAVRSAMVNHGYDTPRMRFRNGVEIGDPDLFIYGLLNDNVGPAASTLRDAGASAEEMAYALNTVGFGPVEIHGELLGRFPDIDSPTQGALVHKITGTDPIAQADIDASWEPHVPNPPSYAASELPDIADLSEREISAVFTADDFANTYEQTNGARPQPVVVGDRLRAAGYSDSEVARAVERLGTRNPVEETMRQRLVASGWEPGQPIPYPDIEAELSAGGRSSDFVSTMMDAFRRFMGDDTGSKWIGGGGTPRSSDRGRVRQAYEAYQQADNNYSDYDIRRMLSQEGYDFDAIEDVGESITGRSYRTAEGAPGHPPAEGGGMTRREFSQTMGAAGAGLAAGGGGGLLGEATRLGGVDSDFLQSFAVGIRGLRRMHGERYAEDARRIMFERIMDAIESGEHTPETLDKMVEMFSEMPRGTIPSASFAPEGGLYRLRNYLNNRPDGALPISMRRVNELARGLLRPDGGVAAAQFELEYGVGGRLKSLSAPHGGAPAPVSGRGADRLRRTTETGSVKVTDLDREIARRHNASYQASENPAEDYGIGSTTSQTGGDPDKRYIVAPSKEWEVMGGDGGFITPEDVAAYRDAFANELTEGRYIGTWFNPDNGRVYLDISEGYDYPSQARRIAQEAEQEGFFDFQAGRFLPAGQTPIPEGARYMPPPIDGHERWLRGVSNAVPQRRMHGADSDPTRGRWFLPEEGHGRSIAGDYGRVDPQKFFPEDRGAMVAVDVPRGTQMDNLSQSLDGPHGPTLMPRDQLPNARLEQGSGLLAVQDNPNALYPRPDPRKALLPALLGGAYLGMQDEEKKPALLR